MHFSGVVGVGMSIMASSCVSAPAKYFDLSQPLSVLGKESSVAVASEKAADGYGGKCPPHVVLGPSIPWADPVSMSLVPESCG